MKRSSSWTGRAPRTMQDAFGPYTSHAIHETAPQHRAWPWLVWAAVLVCCLLLIVLGVAR